MTAAIVLNASDSSSLNWALDYPAQQLQQGATPSISLRGTLPSWTGDVVNRIVELAALPTVNPGGSSPMGIDDVVDVLNFLSRVMDDETMPPWIGRLSSGGVQLTWRSGDVEVEAVFDRARNEREVVVVVGANEWDAPADQADSLFATVRDRLSYAHLESTSPA